MERRGDASRKRPSTADEEQIARPSSKRRGGIYVPPYRPIAEDDDAGEFGSAEYQRCSWNALRKKSITGLVNKATAANVRHVAPELLAENLVRGRGLLCRALLRSQAACPDLTDVFAALAAVVNAWLPCVGRLLLVRLVLRVRRAHASGNRHQLVECCKKEKAYTSYYGRLAQRLCAIGRAYQAGFEACFAGHYSAAHRMATDELRATARLYAHLLAADALPWHAILGRVRVTEDNTTSSLRIFIKMLFQDLVEHLGIQALSNKMNDDDTAVRDALFPRLRQEHSLCH